MINPFARPGRWYRANLHTHTTTSDGAHPPARVAEFYRRQGYHVLALTDHGATNDVAKLCRRGFLVLNGLEHGAPLRDNPNDVHHLVALNIPRDFKMSEDVGRDANAFIRAVQAAGGETILAHPYWSRHRYDQVAYLDGYVAVEVYNGTADTIGRACSETEWSQLLDAGRVIPAVAVDDSHGRGDIFQGWIWLKLEQLTPQAVMAALRTGCYYSSTGPRITDLRLSEDGRLNLRCSPAQAVYVIAHNAGLGAAYHAGRKPLRAFSLWVPPEWTCFRVVVVDAAGRRAWTNPFVLGEADRELVRRRFEVEQQRNWQEAYPAVARSGTAAWQPLDLTPVFNRPLCGRNAWIGMGMQLDQLPGGLHTIHGVPFRTAAPLPPDVNAAVAMRSERLRDAAGRPLPRCVRIAVHRTCRAVYFLHGAGFVSEHAPLAAYRFVYADGSERRVVVWGLGKDTGDGRRRATRERRAGVQDWWPTYRQFENQQARKVIVAKAGEPTDCRYLYTLEWRNPQPGKVLREIRLEAGPKCSAALLVLAITLQQ